MRREVFPAPEFDQATHDASFLGGYLDAGISAPLSADPYERPASGFYRDRLGHAAYGRGFDYYGD